MALLNLGCGKRFHKSWTNIDFVSTGEGVLAHNLLEGIPFGNETFDVVYHSHVLEHFNKTDAISFINECFRVLKAGGIIRIAVPDLETISKEYLINLERAINHEVGAEFDYEWIILEMYDQIVRNASGGEMAKYFYRKEIPNKEYVFTRIGDEGKTLHENYLNSFNNRDKEEKSTIPSLTKTCIKWIYQFPKKILMQTFFQKEVDALEIGRFRLSGEVHNWMYDKYSLGFLLNKSGFADIRIVTAFESSVSEWSKYELDVINGAVLKPDSLFMEAVKPS